MTFYKYLGTNGFQNWNVRQNIKCSRFLEISAYFYIIVLKCITSNYSDALHYYSRARKKKTKKKVRVQF